MHGLMMNSPLTITSIMKHADRNHPDSEIVSVTVDNPRHRYTYREAFIRTRKLACALSQYGIKPDDRIGTLAWNDYRHFELYYAVSGVGAITHMINPRLSHDQITFIINHAEDRLIFVDPLIVPVLEKIIDAIKNVEAFVILTDMAHMPETSLVNVKCYESFIGDGAEDFEWPEFDENTASSLCYTSGTTGYPKGVLYSHRAIVLHSLAEIAPDVFNLSIREVIMPVVPMFHVNAWGIPYAAPIVGAKLVFPGAKMGDGETLQALIEEEGVTFSAGVPTVWLMLLNYLEKSAKTVASLRRVIIGGATCPLSILIDFREKHDVTVQQAWGMTEMTPLGTVNTLKPGMENIPADELNQLKLKQGRFVYGVEMKIIDDDNKEQPWDGLSPGLLKVRGPWISSNYYKKEGDDDTFDTDGWFSTGDIATIDEDGFMQITDRSKDVIKSGGEWISSIELENIAIGHPTISEAAVIGINHPKWTERPLLIVVLKENEEVGKKELLAWMAGKVPKWWLPDDVLFIDEIPHTATGKIQKTELRKLFKDYKFPSS
ncbi:MAG: long-chain-fatty-acid--CoA ligase [Gammaproteobacteria bacterium]|nr:long-chain-fatty-acid--CoA ligase [Gammaproteobacteria bacterium]